VQAHPPRAGAFYETFAAEMAHELKNKFEYHYTPKKASWLNMVEIELSIIAQQCLDRRIPNMTELAQEVKSLVQKRNRLQATIQWRFTTAKARTKVRIAMLWCKRIKVTVYYYFPDLQNSTLHPYYDSKTTIPITTSKRSICIRTTQLDRC
jgi:DDE superfamily endonuclease